MDLSTLSPDVLSSILASIPRNPQSMGPQDVTPTGNSQVSTPSGPMVAHDPPDSSPLVQAAILGAMHGAASAGAHPLVGLHGLLQGALGGANAGNGQLLTNSEQYSVPAGPPNPNVQGPKPPMPQTPQGPPMFGDLSVGYKAPSVGQTPSLETPTITNPETAPIQYKPTAVPSKEDYTADPKIQDLRDAASHLYQQASQLDPPKFPGMSLVQALVGIAGGVATQDNPKAQFVANYLPSLGKAIQDKYGNSQQAWQVARENLLTQAQSMAKQASDLQEAGLKKYSTDVGYAGKLNVQDLKNQGNVNVENLKQNGLGIRSAIQRAGKDGATAARLITSEDPNARIQGYDILRKNGLSNWTDEQIDEASKTETAKQALQAAQGVNQRAQANFKNVTAQPTADNLESSSNLKDSQANQIDTLLPARLAALQEVPNLSRAKQAEIAQKTALMGPLAAATIGRAASYADAVKGTNQFHSDQIGLGYAGLTQKANAEAQMNIRTGMNTLSTQANVLRQQIGKRAAQLQAQSANDPDAAKTALANDPQLQAMTSALSGYQDQYGEFEKTIQGLGKAYNSAPTMPSPTIPTPNAAGGLAGPIGPNGSRLNVVPQGGAPEPPPIDTKTGQPKAGASKAVTQANANKPKPLPSGVTADQMIASANKQIRNGADRAAVLKRLAEYGVVVK